MRSGHVSHVVQLLEDAVHFVVGEPDDRTSRRTTRDYRKRTHLEVLFDIKLDLFACEGSYSVLSVSIRLLVSYRCADERGTYLINMLLVVYVENLCTEEPDCSFRGVCAGAGVTMEVFVDKMR